MTIKYETAKLAIEIYEKDKDTGLLWETAVYEASVQVKTENNKKKSRYE